MVMLSVLFVIMASFLIISYIVCDRDMMAPEVLFIAGFILAITAAIMNIEAWGIDLSIKTFLIIIVGTVSFMLSGLCYRTIHNKESIKNGEELSYIKIPRWKTVLVIFFDLITIFLYYHEVTRLANYADPYWRVMGVMVAYKRVISFGSMTINPIVNQLTKVVYSFGYIYIYVFINNHFAIEGAKQKKSNAEYMIPVVLFGMMSIIKGNRIDIIGLIVMAVFLYYMFLHKKIGWTKHVSGKLLRKALVIFVVAMIAFYYIKDIVGRVSSLNFLEYITQYIGGSIQLLDQYIRDGVASNKVPFGETLTGLITGLRKLGLNTVSLRKQLEFRYTSTGVYLGNVYTALRRYYNDAGWIGVIAFPAFLSFFMNRYYRKVRRCRGISESKMFKTIVYASLLYVVPLQAMEDSFYINKVTIGYAIELLILYVCVHFIFIKIKIWRGKSSR